MAVNLQKGQKISLEKEAGSALTKVVMGLGWDVAKKKGFFGFGGGSAEIDLDSSCLMLMKQGKWWTSFGLDSFKVKTAVLNIQVITVQAQVMATMSKLLLI